MVQYYCNIALDLGAANNGPETLKHKESFHRRLPLEIVAAIEARDGGREGRGGDGGRHYMDGRFC